MIARIDHFVLTVADLETSLGFYETVLGMKRHLEPGRPAALLFGSQKINLHQVDHMFEPRAKNPTLGAGDFCLVADGPLTDVQTHLERSGVEIEVGPVKRTGALGAMTSIYFRDPDGNLVEIGAYFDQ